MKTKNKTENGTRTKKDYSNFKDKYRNQKKGTIKQSNYEDKKEKTENNGKQSIQTMKTENKTQKVLIYEDKLKRKGNTKKKPAK